VHLKIILLHPWNKLRRGQHHPKHCYTKVVNYCTATDGNSRSTVFSSALKKLCILHLGLPSGLRFRFLGKHIVRVSHSLSASYNLFRMSFAGGMWYAYHTRQHGAENRYFRYLKGAFTSSNLFSEPSLRDVTSNDNKGSLMPRMNDAVSNVQLPNIDPRRWFLTYLCSGQMYSLCVCARARAFLGGWWRLSRTQMVVMPGGSRST
jgi:hypothetical protein